MAKRALVSGRINKSAERGDMAMMYSAHTGDEALLRVQVAGDLDAALPETSLHGMSRRLIAMSTRPVGPSLYMLDGTLR